MTPQEWRATAALSAIQALRMFGMFMILPVFALYARDLPGGVKEWQVGLAIGLYGIVQAILQIPFGMLSDRIGRKPVIVFGLLLFAAGSFLAGATHDIGWIMAGRALQGAGAISGAVSALLADVTRVQVRTQAMAILGVGIGLSFIIALILGPLFDGWIGVNGIFNLTGIGAILAIPLVLRTVPAPDRRLSVPLRGFAATFKDAGLLRLDLGIFLLHVMMTTLFIAAPLAIEKTLGLPRDAHWHVYLPVLLVSVLLVFPMIRRIEAKGRTRPVFIAAVAVLGLALALAGEAHAHAAGLIAALLLFFLAFNYLEGTLPSLISRRAPVQRKGAALGVYSTAQFLGGGLGSNFGAYAVAHGGLGVAFAAAALLSVIWLPFAVATVPAEDPHSADEHPADAVQE